MPARTNIVKKTLRGISKAHKDYEAWSDLWLWQAPEYMITTYIAKEIAPVSPYVTLEQNAGESTEAGGGVGKGKVSDRTQRKLERGRFDIAVWRRDDTPIVIIEVKKQPIRFNQISGDVDNICRVLKGKKNYFQYGLIAYYLGLERKTNAESAEERTSRIVEEIRGEADSHIKRKRGLKLRQHLSHPKPQVAEDSAWIGVVLQISKSSQ